MDTQTSKQFIDGLAIAAKAVATTTIDPRVSLPVHGAAMLLSLIGRLLETRSADEARAILETIVAEGTKPISEAELQAQAERVIAELQSD